MWACGGGPSSHLVPLRSVLWCVLVRLCRAVVEAYQSAMPTPGMLSLTGAIMFQAAPCEAHIDPDTGGGVRPSATPT
jgi:hypothetical protein